MGAYLVAEALELNQIKTAYEAAWDTYLPPAMVEYVRFARRLLAPNEVCSYYTTYSVYATLVVYKGRTVATKTLVMVVIGSDDRYTV